MTDKEPGAKWASEKFVKPTDDAMVKLALNSVDLVILRFGWTWSTDYAIDAALRGTQGAVDAAKHVLDGTWDAAFSCARPPGHHAEPNRSMGFCLFDSIAVAARWAQAELDLERVAILDWDVHHGNGTAEAFRHRADVLTKSGFMVGLGETPAEVEELLRDLRGAEFDSRNELVARRDHRRAGAAQHPSDE